MTMQTDPEPDEDTFEYTDYALSDLSTIREFQTLDGPAKAPLPPAAPVRLLTSDLRASLATGELRATQEAGRDVIAFLSEYYGLRVPTLQVLGARPIEVSRAAWGHCASELFGDYDPCAIHIRLWMRTARKRQITSFGCFLSTLLHEFCHHLDWVLLAPTFSPHTRGFLHRVDDLYHLALGTPRAKRRKLHWFRIGRSWRVDWTLSRPAIATAR